MRRAACGRCARAEIREVVSMQDDVVRERLRRDGRIVVVSGAAGGGIGTSITRLIARAGARVIAVSRSPENLDKHIGPLVSQGLPITPLAADAQTEEGVAAVLKCVSGA